MTHYGKFEAQKAPHLRSPYEVVCRVLARFSSLRALLYCRHDCCARLLFILHRTTTASARAWDVSSLFLSMPPLLDNVMCNPRGESQYSCTRRSPPDYDFRACLVRGRGHRHE